MQSMQRAGRRQKTARRVSRHRAAPRWRGRDSAISSWRSGSRLAGGDAELPFDEVEPGHRLGYRVLDLQPRVHLDEIELAGRASDDELDRAGADIADRARRRDRRLADARRAASGSRPGAGASSTIFWCRRWIEQSRSNRCTMLPWLSPKTWTSMCRGRVEIRSISTGRRRTPPCASRLAPASARANSPASPTTRMPRPPPPADALISTGKPIRSASASSSASVLVGAVIARHDRHAVRLHQRLGRGLRAHRADRRRPAGR